MHWEHYGRRGAQGIDLGQTERFAAGSARHPAIDRRGGRRCSAPCWSSTPSPSSRGMDSPWLLGAVILADIAGDRRRHLRRGARGAGGGGTHRASQAQLGEAQARLGAIVDSAMDAVITVDERRTSCCSTAPPSRCSAAARAGARHAARALHPAALPRRAPRPRRGLRPHRRHQPAHGRRHHAVGAARRQRRGVPDRGLDLAGDRGRAALLHRDPARHHAAQAGRGRAAGSRSATCASCRRACWRRARRRRRASRASCTTSSASCSPRSRWTSPGCASGCRGASCTPRPTADGRAARPDRRRDAAHLGRPAPADARRPRPRRRGALAGGGLRQPLRHRLPHRGRRATARCEAMLEGGIDRGLPRDPGIAHQHRAPCRREERLGRRSRRADGEVALRGRGRRPRHRARGPRQGALARPEGHARAHRLPRRLARDRARAARRHARCGVRVPLRGRRARRRHDPRPHRRRPQDRARRPEAHPRRRRRHRGRRRGGQRRRGARRW